MGTHAPCILEGRQTTKNVSNVTITGWDQGSVKNKPGSGRDTIRGALLPAGSPGRSLNRDNTG
jgi:hypothetical protein